MVTCNKHGFTLIELLVVMAIIGVLAGLLMAGMSLVRESLAVNRTRSIIANAQAAVAVGGDQGAIVLPVTHPLAPWASTSCLGDPIGPRAIFYRYIVAGTVVGPHLALETTPADRAHSLALLVDNPGWVISSANRRILGATDLFAGYMASGDVPSLFGLPRSSLGILGLPAEWIGQVRVLPKPVAQWLGTDGLLRRDTNNDYGSGIYPDDQFLRIRPYRGTIPYEDRVDREMRRALGSSLGELADAGALVAAPGASTSAWITAPPSPAGPVHVVSQLQGTYDPHHRVWIDDEVLPSWIPGTVQIAGKWHRDRPRGLSLTDGWGRELLYVIGPGGSPRFLSAGKDGCFVLHPGLNGKIDTPIATFDAALHGPPMNDDRDATRDNIGAIP